MRKTKIEWADDTWNPIRGCSRVSAGCVNCYAEGTAHRFSGVGLPYEGLTNDRGVWNGRIKVVDEHMTDPLRWREPRRVFVNSMSDLFHENVADEVIDTVFAVMALASRHTFMVLTKRPDRMLQYMNGLARYPPGHCWENALRSFRVFKGDDHKGQPWIQSFNLPLKNVHLGVSVEDVKALARIPTLMRTPAAVRFLSLEPLIERVDVSPWLTAPGACIYVDGKPTRGLDWLIVGGESGPGARPCALEWIETIVDHARATATPVFVKQLGAYVVSEERAFQDAAEMRYARGPDAKWPADRWAWRAGFEHPKAGNLHEWPTNLQVREYPRS